MAALAAHAKLGAPTTGYAACVAPHPPFGTVPSLLAEWVGEGPRSPRRSAPSVGALANVKPTEAEKQSNEDNEINRQVRRARQSCHWSRGLVWLTAGPLGACSC